MKIKLPFSPLHHGCLNSFKHLRLTLLFGELQERGTFFAQVARNPGERSGHGKSILIWPSEVGRDKRQPLMPSQIFHVATIALMISSQTNGKHTDQPQQNGREVTSLVRL